MLMVNNLIGFGAGGTQARDFLGIITELGLTSGLKLCLDAGDAASYTSGQTWADRSGNGTDFYRGSGSGADGSDPTFNGSSGGLSSAEYFSFDGGDYFTQVAASNPAWIQNLHKNNAVYSIIAWAYVGDTSASFANRILGDFSSASNIGVRLLVNSAGQLTFQVANGSGTLAKTDIIGGITSDSWFMGGVTYDESSESGYIFNNSASGVISGPYVSPSSSSATYKLRVGDDGGGNEMSAGSRIGGLMVWEGVSLSLAQINAIYAATRWRFGV